MSEVACKRKRGEKNPKAEAWEMLFQNREVAITAQILSSHKWNIGLRNIGTLRQRRCRSVWTHLRNDTLLHRKLWLHHSWGRKRGRRALGCGCLPTGQLREEGWPSSHRSSWRMSGGNLAKTSQARLATAQLWGSHVYKQGSRKFQSLQERSVDQNWKLHYSSTV